MVVPQYLAAEFFAEAVRIDCTLSHLLPAASMAFIAACHAAIDGASVRTLAQYSGSSPGRAHGL